MSLACSERAAKTIVCQQAHRFPRNGSRCALFRVLQTGHVRLGTAMSDLFRPSLISLLLLLTLLGGLEPVRGETVPFRAAAKHYRAGQWELAADSFLRVLDSAPKDSGNLQASFYLAECQMQLGQYASALQQYDLLLNGTHTELNSQILFRAGEAARLLGRYDEARRHLKDFLQRHPEDSQAPYAWRYLGDLARDTSAPSNAIALYQTVLRKFPDFPDRLQVKLSLARVLLDQGSMEAAQPILNELENVRDLEVATEAKLLAGRALFEQGHYESALERFRSISRKLPEQSADSRARIAAAWALWRMERFDEIDEEVSPLVNRPQWISDYHYLRGMAAYGSQYWSRGASHLAKAAALQPDHPSHDAIVFYQGVCHLRNEQELAAKTLFERLSVEHPHSVWRDDALWELARLARAQSDSEEYEARREQLQTAVPTSDYITSFYDEPAPSQPKDNLEEAQALLDEAVGFQRDGHHHSAMATYEELLDLTPANRISYEALWRYAKLAQQRKRFPLAEKLYRRLLAERPESAHAAEASFALAQLKSKQGKRLEAQELFQNLLEKSPQSAQAAPAAYWLAVREADEGDSESALEHCQLALQAAEACAPSQRIEIEARTATLVCRISAAQGDWAAVEKYIRSLEPESLPLEACFWAAEAAFRLNEHDIARNRFEKLAVQTIGHYESWTAMVSLRQAQLAARRQQWQRVNELANYIEHEYPDFELQYEVDYLRGRAHAGRGKLTTARRYYREVLSNPTAISSETAAAAQWMIGETHFHQQNYEAARMAYEELIERDAPADWRARAALQAGKCWELQQNWEQALTTYADALERWPNTEPQPQLAARLKWAEDRTQIRR